MVLVLTATLASGCLDSASLSLKRELVVDFAPAYQTDQAVHAAARTACSGIPGVTTVVPGPRSLPVYNVVFDITRASDTELARLYACLAKQPGVEGAHQEGGSIDE